MPAEAVNLSSVKAMIVAALQRASAATGSDFHYLLGTAMRESSLKPQAQSSTSSAAGLFQFVEQTWLGLVKRYGGKYGLGSSASAITKGSDGRYHTDNDTDRQAILALRNDPQASALMAGEYAGECKSQMQNTLGREVSGGELYAAHFLGADSACRLIKMSETAPDTSAASAFPQAADANKSVFYHADGSAKTVREVYEWATKQPSTAGASEVAQAQPGLSKAEYVAVIAQFENRMFASALLSEPSSRNGLSGGATSPVRMSYGVLDVLSALQGAAPKRENS